VVDKTIKRTVDLFYTNTDYEIIIIIQIEPKNASKCVGFGENTNIPNK